MDDLLDHATAFSFVPSGSDRSDMTTRHFRVKVEWRGNDRWVISHWQELWNGDDWEYEPTNSSQDDAFRERTSFTRDHACALAQELADTVEVEDAVWVDWKARRDAARIARRHTQTQ